MKFLLINGSPHENGCTNRALTEIGSALLAAGHEYDILWLKYVQLCTSCRSCKDHHIVCSFDNVITNFVEISSNYDGFFFGSPVIYGNISSKMSAFLTRLFFSAPKTLKHKPVACVLSSRRAGSLMALSSFYAPFLMHSCVIVGSQYWNEVHGDTPDEVDLDYEGLQCMRTLALNVIFVAENLKDKTPPTLESPKHLNFISREYKELLK